MVSLDHKSRAKWLRKRERDEIINLKVEQTLTNKKDTENKFIHECIFVCTRTNSLLEAPDFDFRMRVVMQIDCVFGILLVMAFLTLRFLISSFKFSLPFCS